MFMYVNLKLYEGPRKRANRGGDPNLDLIQGGVHGVLNPMYKRVSHKVNNYNYNV